VRPKKQQAGFEKGKKCSFATSLLKCEPAVWKIH